jgi:hypothetical protein
MGYSGAGGKLIHEKNQKQKISWHCPFKPMETRIYRQKYVNGSVNTEINLSIYVVKSPVQFVRQSL